MGRVHDPESPGFVHVKDGFKDGDNKLPGRIVIIDKDDLMQSWPFDFCLCSGFLLGARVVVRHGCPT